MKIPDRIALVLAYTMVAVAGPGLCLMYPKRFPVRDYIAFLMGRE